MLNTAMVLLVGAVMAAAAAFWVLRAYRRGGADARAAPRAMAACGVVAVVALGVYLALGRPDLASGAYAARMEALTQRDPTTYTPEEQLVVWAEIARRFPNDPVPHLNLGDVNLQLNRPAEAARAYDAALRRDPQSVDALLGMGRALVAIDNSVSPEALAYFEQAAALTNDAAPVIYQAMAAMETGRDADARRLWGEALARMTPDDPRRDMAQRMSQGS